MLGARRSSISVLSDGQPRSRNASMSTPLPLELLHAWRVAKRKPSDEHEASMSFLFARRRSVHIARERICHVCTGRKTPGGAGTHTGVPVQYAGPVPRCRNENFARERPSSGVEFAPLCNGKKTPGGAGTHTGHTGTRITPVRRSGVLGVEMKTLPVNCL